MDEQYRATWFKAMRNDDAVELLATNPIAFALLYLIAFRAQRTRGFNRHNLRPGEALIGDCDACGMSERQYRTAKQLLEKHGFATFKATTRGTIATLTDARIFDVNIEKGDEQNDERPTIKRRTPDERPTTTKNAKKVKKGESGPPGLSAFAAELLEKFGAAFQETHRTPHARTPGEIRAAEQFADIGPSPKEIVETFTKAWNSKALTKFQANAAGTLETGLRHWPEIVAALVKGTKSEAIRQKARLAFIGEHNSKAADEFADIGKVYESKP